MTNRVFEAMNELIAALQQEVIDFRFELAETQKENQALQEDLDSIYS